ncbi:MAG: Sec-independent protein translocase protein TatB [Alphaproteobacteria bacterium]
MLDIGWPELAVIALIALIVIGPRDLPKALYTLGKWMRALRRMTSDFQRHVDDMVRDTELEDVRKSVQQASKFNIKKEIEKTIDPTGNLKGAFDVNAAKSAKADSTGKDAAKAAGTKPAAKTGAPIEAKPGAGAAAKASGDPATAVNGPMEPAPAGKAAARKTAKRTAAAGKTGAARRTRKKSTGDGTAASLKAPSPESPSR